LRSDFRTDLLYRVSKNDAVSDESQTEFVLPHDIAKPPRGLADRAESRTPKGINLCSSSASKRSPRSRRIVPIRVRAAKRF